jgi:hypothetical protein
MRLRRLLLRLLQRSLCHAQLLLQGQVVRCDELWQPKLRLPGKDGSSLLQCRQY